MSTSLSFYICASVFTERSYLWWLCVVRGVCTHVCLFEGCIQCFNAHTDNIYDCMNTCLILCILLHHYICPIDKCNKVKQQTLAHTNGHPKHEPGREKSVWRLSVGLALTMCLTPAHSTINLYNNKLSSLPGTVFAGLKSLR